MKNYLLLILIVFTGVQCTSPPEEADSKSKYLIEIPLPIEFPLSQLNPYTDIPDDRYKLGQGLKTGTYEVVQRAIDTTKILTERSTPSNGGKTDVTYQYADDFASLKTSMGLSVSLNAKVGWFSLNSSMKDLQSTVQNNLSTFLIAKISVKNHTVKMKTPTLFKSAEKLLLDDPSAFYTNYGDRFISGQVNGGELHVIYEFLANSVQEKRDLFLNVKASASTLTNSVEAVVNYTKSLEDNRNSKKVKVHIVRFGDLSDLPNDDLASMLNFIKTFPNKVSAESGSETFLYYITEKYTSALYTGLLTSKQLDLDKLAEHQRRIFQLISWKQEQINEAMKSTDFALDTTTFKYEKNQYSSFKDKKKELRDQYLAIDNCYYDCADLTKCNECLKLISKDIFFPDFFALEQVKKFSYKLIGETAITHDETQLGILEKKSKYRLEFQGMLLAPGNIPFESFVSPGNDSRAVFTVVPPKAGLAYPIIFIKIFNNGTLKSIPLPIENRVMELKTNEYETVIRGANRYYYPQLGGVDDVPVYLTPASGYGWPTVKIYKWQ